MVALRVSLLIALMDKLVIKKQELVKADVKMEKLVVAQVKHLGVVRKVLSVEQRKGNVVEMEHVVEMA